MLETVKVSILTSDKDRVKSEAQIQRGKAQYEGIVCAVQAWAISFKVMWTVINTKSLQGDECVRTQMWVVYTHAHSWGLLPNLVLKGKHCDSLVYEALVRLKYYFFYQQCFFLLKKNKNKKNQTFLISPRRVESRNRYRIDDGSKRVSITKFIFGKYSKLSIFNKI